MKALPVALCSDHWRGSCASRACRTCVATSPCRTRVACPDSHLWKMLSSRDHDSPSALCLQLSATVVECRLPRHRVGHSSMRRSGQLITPNVQWLRRCATLNALVLGLGYVRLQKYRQSIKNLVAHLVFGKIDGRQMFEIILCRSESFALLVDKRLGRNSRLYDN